MIKKIIFLIVILLINVSCSRSVYYAYEKDGTYATLELTKDNNDIIYRAKSKEYYSEKKYIYFESRNNSRSDQNVHTIGFFILKYIKENEEFMACFANSNNKGVLNDYLEYYAENDSIFLKKNSKLNKNFDSEPCFKKTGITWFPPYLKKIKKIDYKKFKLPYKKKYLRTMNPKHR